MESGPLFFIVDVRVVISEHVGISQTQLCFTACGTGLPTYYDPNEGV